LSSFLSELGGITGGVGAEGLAFAAGFAAARALEPAAVTISQDAWHAAQVRRIDPATAAEVAAENYASYDDMASEASYSGWDASRFAYLYRVTLTAPGVGELLTMLRRGTINPGNFTHGLRKAKLEPMWDDALTELQHARLSPAEIALGIVRSVVADPGLLAVTLDVSGGVVPAYPTWPGDALQEAQAGGFDADRLRVLVGEIGLPMSAQQAASAYFRSIIRLPDFNRAILEGDTRPEWAPFILDQARQILTAGEYAELELRGYYDRATRLANTAKHGMSDADSDLLFDVLGRSIPVHQITTGEARGGVYGDTSETIPEAYLRSLQRGNLRPEYYSLAYANRYSYPSAFVVRALLTDGAITQAEGEQIFLDVGWTPDLAKLVSEHYAPTGAKVADAHVTKAYNQLWTTAHASYKAEEVTQADVTPALNLLGVSPAAQTEIFAAWDVERGLIRKQLTPAQVKKAYKGAVPNLETGQPWTRDDALTALLDRGYSMADATTFLEL
jgi:hypothetical protein